jgi:hypothetical protein
VLICSWRHASANADIWIARMSRFLLTGIRWLWYHMPWFCWFKRKERKWKSASVASRAGDREQWKLAAENYPREHACYVCSNAPARRSFSYCGHRARGR